VTMSPVFHIPDKPYGLLTDAIALLPINSSNHESAEDIW
jgi:hypothetical protein